MTSANLNPEPTARVAAELGFAPLLDAPIPYMQRLRDWKLAVDGGTPYVWAHSTDVPFSVLRKPLADSSVELITTAALYQPDKGDGLDHATTPKQSSLTSTRNPRPSTQTYASRTLGSTVSTQPWNIPGAGSHWTRSVQRPSQAGSRA